MTDKQVLFVDDEPKIQKEQNSGQTPTDAAKLRKWAEEQARTLEPISLSAQTPEEIQQILHELRVHQIELEMQNEELRTAQEEIVAGRDRYYDLYELAPVAYCILSEHGLFLEANLTATTLLGVARSALLRQPISRFILNEDEDIHYLHRKQLFETGEPQEYALRLVKPGGAFIWAHLTATAAQAEDGAPLCRVVLSNITEWKQAEEALVRQQRSIKLFNRIANVFLTSSQNEVFADVLDVILKALDSRFGYFGYIDEAGDLVSPSMTRDVWDQCQISEKSVVFPRSSWGGLWGRSLLEKQTLIANENLQLPKGHVTLANALATPIVYNDKLIGQFVVANKAGGYDKHDRDLLENTAAQTAPILFAIQEEARRRIVHEKLENQLHQARKLEAIGTLAAGIAHEINTPMQYVQNNVTFFAQAFSDISRLFTELARTRQNDNREELLQCLEVIDLDYLIEEIPEAINEAREGIDRVVKIVSAMKAFSHPGSSNRVAADINQALVNTVTVCCNEYKYVAEMVLDLQADLPNVPCFPDQLNQAMLNLIVNAAHAIEESGAKFPDNPGRITISTRTCGDTVEIRVQDSGKGIPEEIRSLIYDPFFTTKVVGKGTGQGLTIVHDIIVQKHHGSLDFITEPGMGTTFIVRLPATII
jgi:PAS domain S-box-containing protein